MIYDDISSTLGRTPLIRLEKLSKELGVNLLVKTESRNPGGSVKDRAAYAMIDDAEKQGKLKKGMVILEATSGNTGIALAAIGRSKGYEVEIMMPESMSVERRKIIAGFGAKLTLTPAAEGMSGAVARAKELVQKNPGKYYMPDQFSNSANPAIHILTTAPEIEIDTGGKIHAVVAGVGTGGTISGVGSYFRMMRQMDVAMVAVEPAGSPVITQKMAGEELRPAPHKIQGIGAGFIPLILDLSVINHVITVEDDEAVQTARMIMKDAGIFCGISGGAAVAGAIKALKTGKINSEKKTDFTVVVILPDSGERYLSTGLYE